MNEKTEEEIKEMNNKKSIKVLKMEEQKHLWV